MYKLNDITCAIIFHYQVHEMSFEKWEKSESLSTSLTTELYINSHGTVLPKLQILIP